MKEVTKYYDPNGNRIYGYKKKKGFCHRCGRTLPASKRFCNMYCKKTWQEDNKYQYAVELEEKEREKIKRDLYPELFEWDKKKK